MTAFTASAPGKIILFGEHAVVYGQPAIAVPVPDVQARAVIQARPGQQGITLLAPELAIKSELADLPLDDALSLTVKLVQDSLGLDHLPPMSILVTSTIPLAAGMGSGAAVSVAIIRALSAFLGQSLTDERVNHLVYQVEKLHHGTPSGIDNTVVTYAKPVFFIKDQPIKTFDIPRPFTLVIGDTGITSPTSKTVALVRESCNTEPDLFQNYFELCGQFARLGWQQITAGRNTSLGPLMDDNHGVLRKMGVSSLELDTLVEAARDAGALGAKLSGGGQGGNMIALVEPTAAEQVADALTTAGAVRTIITTIR
jgi:mevalonate kinase